MLLKIFNNFHLLDGDFGGNGGVSMELSFAPGSLRQCVDILINNDIILEDSESFALELSSPDQVVSIDSTRSTMTAHILDNEQGRVSIVRSTETVMEGEGVEVMVCTILSSGPREAVIVTSVQTEDGTAISGKFSFIIKIQLAVCIL